MVKTIAQGNKAESEIVREICDYLSDRGYFFWRSNNLPVYAMSGSGFKRFRSLPKYTPRGIPDILLVKDGVLNGIEVKREGAKLRPEQAEFGSKLVIHGGRYHIVHSLDDLTRYFT